VSDARANEHSRQRAVERDCRIARRKARGRGVKCAPTRQQLDWRFSMGETASSPVIDLYGTAKWQQFDNKMKISFNNNE
jgi:hypothetical protein